MRFDISLETQYVTVYNIRFGIRLKYLKKNLNAPRPSEHPPVRGKKCQNV